MTNKRFTAPGVDEPIDKDVQLASGIIFDHFQYVIGAILVGMGLMVSGWLGAGVLLSFGGMACGVVFKRIYFIERYRKNAMNLRVFSTRDEKLWRQIAEACNRVMTELHPTKSDIQEHTILNEPAMGEEVVYLEAEGVRISSWEIRLDGKVLKKSELTFRTILGRTLTWDAYYETKIIAGSPHATLLMAGGIFFFMATLLGGGSLFRTLGISGEVFSYNGESYNYVEALLMIELAASVIGAIWGFFIGPVIHKISVINSPYFAVEWTANDKKLFKKVRKALDDFGLRYHSNRNQ